MVQLLLMHNANVNAQDQVLLLVSISQVGAISPVAEKTSGTTVWFRVNPLAAGRGGAFNIWMWFISLHFL